MLVEPPRVLHHGVMEGGGFRPVPRLSVFFAVFLALPILPVSRAQKSTQGKQGSKPGPDSPTGISQNLERFRPRKCNGFWNTVHLYWGLRAPSAGPLEGETQQNHSQSPAMPPCFLLSFLSLPPYTVIDLHTSSSRYSMLSKDKSRTCSTSSTGRSSSSSSCSSPSMRAR